MKIQTNFNAAKPKPGIYTGISGDEYHAGPGISKTGLWKIYTKTPAHFKGAKPKETKYFDIGKAIDLAILEPESFEPKVMKGPPNRTGNAWKDAVSEATNSQRVVLTAPDYDGALLIRDMVHANAWLHSIICSPNAITGASAYYVDEKTGQLVRVRPDLVRPDHNFMLDLKSCRDASKRGFKKAVGEYGYHAQEGLYVPGWMAAKGCDIAGMVFLAVEKEQPYAFEVYELTPAAVEEGRAAMRQALDTYSKCKESDTWPAYSTAEEAKLLALPRWAHKLTPAPDGDDDDDGPILGGDDE